MAVLLCAGRPGALAGDAPSGAESGPAADALEARTADPAVQPDPPGPRNPVARPAKPGPRVVFDGATLTFDAGDGSPGRRWPAHNDTRCGHAPGKHAAYPSDPACKCPILPGVYRLRPSEKAGRFFGGIWIAVADIRRAKPGLGTRRCGIHSHPTAWRTRSAGCIQMKKADAFALARLVDAALRGGREVPIEVRNPRYLARGPR